MAKLTDIARTAGIDLRGCIVSLHGVYDAQANRKAIFNRGMTPNVNENVRCRKTTKHGRKRLFDACRCGYLQGALAHY